MDTVRWCYKCNKDEKDCECADGLEHLISQPKEFNGLMNKGWLCPKCNRVNAPWLPFCSCNNKTKI